VGLEVAAAAKLNGCDVTVILNSDAPPLSSVLGEELGQHFEDLHQKNGVTFLKEANTTSFTGSTAVEAVETSAGSVPADLVVIGIGADPTVDTAASAGVSTDNGGGVDERMRTSDGSILAIGDIANAQNTLRNERLPIGHGGNAGRQAEVADWPATGGAEASGWEPYSCREQYGLGMGGGGHGRAAAEAVRRGDQPGGACLVFWTRDGRVAEAMKVNVWG